MISSAVCNRFIPAPAGNRSTDCVEISIQASGSSPRLRGTARIHARQGKSFVGDRFIPAPAGNSPTSVAFWSLQLFRGSSPRLRGTEFTCPLMLARSHSPVHPRACGEQTGRGSRPWLRVGSSPRLRGTAATISDPMPLIAIRFIPAPAGNSLITMSLIQGDL